MSDSDEDNRPLPGALPCPFCGGTKIATYAGSTFRWRYAACNECGAQASEVRIETISLPRPEAIAAADRELLAAWNTRAQRAEGAAPDSIPVPRETLKRWKENLSHHWFGGDGEEEYNNDEIIETDGEITALLDGPHGEK